MSIRSQRLARSAPVQVKQTAPPMLQRAAIGHGPASAPPIVHDVLRSPGQPLDPPTSALMETRFGHDFSGVRIHTDAQAAESARAVNALAYTVGRNVVFDVGQYQPQTGEGQRLLAHEMAHVMQQRAASSSRELPIGGPNSATEREAQQAALHDHAGGAVQLFQSAPTLQRQEGPSSLPPVPNFQLSPPSLLRPRPQRSFLAGPRLRFNLLGPVQDDLRSLRGVTRLRPGLPRLLPSSSLASAPATNPLSPSAQPAAPGAGASELVDKIWELDFDLEVEPQSQLGQTLTRFGVPLQSPGAAGAQRFGQLVSMFSGQEAEGTPLSLQLTNLGVNLIGALPPVAAAREQLQRALRVNTITVVANPVENTYGLKVEFRLP